MPSLSARAINAIMRRTIKHDNNASGKALVAHLRRYMNARTPQLLPFGVSASAFKLGSYQGTYVSVDNPTLTILYLHGGGHVAGRPETYHNLAGRLAKTLNAQVYLPRYPLAPEHPFPAAVDYCLGCYEMLLSGEKVAPEQLVLMGDSAGGGLVFATLLGAKQNQLSLPRCSVTFSPAVSAHGDYDSLDRNANSDAMLSANMIKRLPDLYAANEHKDDPRMSPVLGDYRGNTPVFISSCRNECLYDGNKLMAHRLRHQGVSVRWLERFDLVHVWPILLPWLKEARQDFHKIVAFIRQPDAA